MEDNAAIIEKIRKLMALGERGGTEAEAEAAMGKVQELLAKYNLDIDAVRGASEITLVNEHREHPWNQTWIATAYMGIAALYFCKFYTSQEGTNVKRCHLIGEPVNVQTAFYVADVVISTGNRLAKEYAAASRAEYVANGGSEKDSVGYAISMANGFKKGFGLRVNQRCSELILAATKQTGSGTSPGNALVLADFYRKNAAMLDEAARDKFGLRLTTGNGMKSGNGSAMNAGAGAANSVNLRASGIGASGGAFRIGRG